MYGYDVQSVYNRGIGAAEGSMATGAELLLAGTSLVNVFPALKYIPTWSPGAASHWKSAELDREYEKITDAIHQHRFGLLRGASNFKSSFSILNFFI